MDEIQTAVKACFSKYADFKGRAARPEFWWFALFQVIVVTLAGFISESLSGLVSLGLLLPGLAVGARRLHDIGKSGWFMLLWLIPVIGWLVLIYWAAQPGEPAANAYGAPTAGARPTPLVPGQQ